jgi:hypothetical protein
MESNELLVLIEKLPPDAKKQVEDLVETLANKSGIVKAPREFGSLKGFITYIADDFDAPLEDFKDYM